MVIIQSLRKIGVTADFYNIDYFRPKHEEVKSYFGENRFDIVGISAVVSTAYAYTKYLASLIRAVSPHTITILGGNLAASAEILLRKTEVDFCVAGDGELIIQDLVMALQEQSWSYEEIQSIPGLCFLDDVGRFHFTGYGTPPTGDAIDWPDYSLFEADGSLSQFIADTPDFLVEYGVEFPEAMREKRAATVITTKGCVSRCTFCHRWEKGYRMRPTDQIVTHLQYLKDRYDVAFLSIGDENFGSNRKLTHELVEALGEMGFLWRASGVRARTVDLETLKYWKANGCLAVFFGIESGSQQMLDVMEKNTTVQMNVDALKWTYEAGLFTVVQLVLGMPGETDETIKETTEFLTAVSHYASMHQGLPGSSQSVNYAQALPGTPLYEYARENGYIGKNIDDEEQYLLRISDTDAYQSDHFTNYTQQPLLKVLIWPHRMGGEVNASYLEHVHRFRCSFPELIWDLLLSILRLVFGTERLDRISADSPLHRRLSDVLSGRADKDKTGSLNLRRSLALTLFLNPTVRKHAYPLLALAIAIRNGASPVHSLGLISEHLVWSVKSRLRSKPDLPKRSLRKTVTIKPADGARPGSEMTIPLRKGR
jgi:radical SAM superfamily enzyme YgiQ (UPF0313 family)